MHQVITTAGLIDPFGPFRAPFKMNKRRPSIDRHSAGKAGSDRQQACKEVEALLTLESNKYNEALVRGRHPRSFGKSGTIWDHL